MTNAEYSFSLSVSVYPPHPHLGMTIPEEDTEAGQTGKYCLVAIGRLQVCVWIIIYRNIVYLCHALLTTSAATKQKNEI